MFKAQSYEIATQNPNITDEAIAAAEKLVGIDYRGTRATIEITRDAIRDYCNYRGSCNSMFLDEGYARKTRWGGIIAPQTMVGTAIIAPGLRGVQ